MHPVLQADETPLQLLSSLKRVCVGYVSAAGCVGEYVQAMSGWGP
ncbi:hypothetical protein [Escherichia coli]|nr:hypothetical protein [Escherichia coli]